MRFLARAVGIGLTLCSPMLFGASITGQFTFTGQNVEVSATSITWLPTNPGNPGTGIIVASNPPGVTGDFAAILCGPSAGNPGCANVSGTQGSQINLSSPVNPVGIPINLPDFIQFPPSPAAAALGIDLTTAEVAQPNTTACTTTQTSGNCAVYLPNAGGTPGPFELTQVSPNSVTVSLVLDGIAHAAGYSNTAVTITYTDQYTGTIGSITSAIYAGQTLQANAYSATVTAAAVPEPATAFLGLSGLLIGAGVYRRRRRS